MKHKLPHCMTQQQASPFLSFLALSAPVPISDDCITTLILIGDRHIHYRYVHGMHAFAVAATTQSLLSSEVSRVSDVYSKSPRREKKNPHFFLLHGLGNEFVAVWLGWGMTCVRAVTPIREQIEKCSFGRLRRAGNN